jgi:uncharacterized membrane protein YbhN (UPF0104 family)
MTPWMKAAVSAGLLALLFLLLPWQDVRTAAASVRPSLWALVLAGFLAGHQLGVLKWRALVHAARGHLDVRDATRCYSAGLFANLCLPSIVGGDVLRAVLAGRATGRVEAAFLAGIADRALDILTMALLVSGGALLARRAMPGWSGEVLTAGILLGALAAAAAAPFVLRRPLARWPRRLRRPAGRGLVALRHLARRPGAAALALAIALVMQGGFVLLNVLIGRAVGIHLPLAVWFVAWPLAKIAGLMPISLGGLAVRDATFGALLLPFGVPMATGVVAALVWQTVMIAGGLAGGLAWLALSPREPGARGLRGLLSLSAPARGSHG